MCVCVLKQTIKTERDLINKWAGGAGNRRGMQVCGTDVITLTVMKNINFLRRFQDTITGRKLIGFIKTQKFSCFAKFLTRGVYKRAHTDF